MCATLENTMLEVIYNAAPEEFVFPIAATEDLHFKDQCNFSVRGHQHQHIQAATAKAGV